MENADRLKLMFIRAVNRVFQVRNQFMSDDLERWRYVLTVYKEMEKMFIYLCSLESDYPDEHCIPAMQSNVAPIKLFTR